MMQCAAWGRLGQDPRAIETRSGKPMTVASLAVQPADELEEPLWLGVVAFGAQAEALLKHAKGECLSVSGRLQRRRWERDGEQHEQFQVVADSLVSARTVRPGGRRREQPKKQTPAREPEAEFNDDIPF